MDRDRLAMSVFAPVVDDHEYMVFLIESISLAAYLGELGHCDLSSAPSQYSSVSGVITASF